MMRFLSPILFAIAILLSGCPLSQTPAPPAVPSASAEPLSSLLDKTLRENQAKRGLSTEANGAWQILHGVLAYGKDFSIQTPDGEQPAVDYLLAGGEVAGFDPVLGDVFGEAKRRGLRMEVQPNSKIGQGHRDQWLAVLVQSGLEQTAEIKTAAHTFTMRDWVNQTLYDMPLNIEQEFSWTLIAALAYMGTDHRWQARDQEMHSIEEMLRIEVEQDLQASVCGGTHRLIGISMALNKRKSEGAPITGIWAQAQQLIDENIILAKQNQNPDGSYSVSYLHRTGWTKDLGESLGTTGHVLEFLAFAASDETLREPWVERTVRRLCEVLKQCEGIDLECGVLYHALHGLAEYRNRISSS